MFMFDEHECPETCSDDRSDAKPCVYMVEEPDPTVEQNKEQNSGKNVFHVVVVYDRCINKVPNLFPTACPCQGNDKRCTR